MSERRVTASGLPASGVLAGKGTILDVGGSLYTASDPFVASYPGFVAVLYRQSDMNQTDYRGGLELHPYSKITKMPGLRCDREDSNKENRSFRGVSLSPEDKSFLAETV